MIGILGLAACETPQERVTNKEDRLAAAGFLVRPANTPQRQAMLSTLPPHRFLRRVHGDKVTYVYSDPLVCDCLYVGTEQAYNHYRLLMEQERIANEQEMAAEEYNDAAWNWGAWGPWGPGWGFGPGW
ncbi:MAG: hypothetical protein B7Z80_24775 [Rhodospirillales bacterium 20-64-7]|nr:MAG: hypothetical protein B7Z80_24775 [Rhodospirillales bacterium 20-64-7]